MRIVVTAALALGASTVVAQDLVYSDAATESCVYAQETLAGQRTCIGRSANACMAANDLGSTTVGMGGCLSFELDYWDERLNASYKILLRKAKAVDAEMAELGSSAESLAESLLAAQRAWIPWRDSTCDFERAQWGGGTGGGPATYACLMRLTGEQALYLESVQLGE
ncbi:MAG: lysozyme inhibitor LprI family protein [Paracoccaceae bacterium]